MGIGTLAAAYGVVQQILGHARLHELGYEYNSVLRFNGGFLRSVSTFALPFSFGFYMMMVIVICLPVALSDHVPFAQQALPHRQPAARRRAGRRASCAPPCSACSSACCTSASAASAR